MPIINQIISSFVQVIYALQSLNYPVFYALSIQKIIQIIKVLIKIKFNSNSFTLPDICGLYNSEFLGVLHCIMLIVPNCDMDKDHDNFSIRLQFIKNKEDCIDSKSQNTAFIFAC